MQTIRRVKQKEGVLGAHAECSADLLSFSEEEMTNNTRIMDNDVFQMKHHESASVNTSVSLEPSRKRQNHPTDSEDKGRKKIAQRESRLTESPTDMDSMNHHERKTTVRSMRLVILY